MDEVIIIERESQVVIGMRMKGAYHDVSKMIPRVYEHAMKTGLEITGPPVFICHEMTMEEVENVMKNSCADLEIALPVKGKIRETEGIKRYEVPGGKMARIMHIGPYEKVGETYNKLFSWMAENNQKLAGGYREYYLNDPNEVKTEEIMTEINAPLE